MKRLNKQLTSESGRSMVEILGVLAIIGVLSIGGIAGYTYAMNKSKANDILDGVSKRAVVVSQQMILGNTASLVEYNGKNIGDYGVALDTSYGAEMFGIKVSGIEEDVCEHLQAKELGNASDIYIGDDYSDEATCAESGNTLTYVFSDTLDPNKTSGAGGGVCASGIVKVYNCETKKTTDCCPDEETCEQPTCSCSGDGDCPGDQACSGGTCGCPVADYSGFQGTLSNDGTTCCFEGFAWHETWECYEKTNIPACGCPPDMAGDRGTLSADGTTCCLAGGAWDGSSNYYDVNIPACGCLWGGELSKSDSTVCCLEGKAWDDNDYDYDKMNISACGCPIDGNGNQGTPSADGTTCCLDGKGWIWNGYPGSYIKDNLACGS